jgi:membrane protein DedA with SNARE-associated domain
VFEWITSVIARRGYVGVAALTCLENLFPPIPSELVIPLAGFVAAQGDLRLSLVIVMGSVGSLAGALVWYAIGKRVGEQRLREWVNSTWTVAHSERRRFGSGAAVVSAARCRGSILRPVDPCVRTFVSLPAGFSSKPLGPFLLYSVLGTAMWTAALAYAGVMLQANLTLVGDYIDVGTNSLLALGGILLAKLYIRCWRAPAAG